MNTLAKAILDTWENTTAVNDILAVENVYNGTYVSDEQQFPYATITFPGSSIDMRTNRKYCQAEEETARIALYYDNESYDVMQSLIKQVRRAYDKYDATLDDDEGGISDGIIQSVQEIQDQDESWWTTVIDLNLKVTRDVV